MRITEYLRSNARVAKGALSKSFFLFASLSLAISTAAAQTGFDEQAVAKFYRGKTVKIIVGLPPGGSFDITARAIAKRINKYIPGNPTLIVENLPGAGGVLALNRVYNTMPKDGTIIATTPAGILIQQIFKNPGVRFDARKLRMLGLPAPTVHMLVVTKKSGVTKLEQLMGPNPAKKVKLGATSVGSAIYNSATLAKLATGLDYQIVTGYRGFPPIKLALEQGELDGTYSNIYELRGLYQDKLKSGDWVILAQNSLTAHMDAPSGAPVLGTLAKTAEGRQKMQMGSIVLNEIAFLYYVAPGVPEDRVQALRQAFAKTMADKDYVADMAKARLPVEPRSAEEVEKKIADFLNMPAKLRDELRPVMTTR